MLPPTLEKFMCDRLCRVCLIHGCQPMSVCFDLYVSGCVHCVLMPVLRNWLQTSILQAHCLPSGCSPPPGLGEWAPTPGWVSIIPPMLALVYIQPSVKTLSSVPPASGETVPGSVLAVWVNVSAEVELIRMGWRGVWGEGGTTADVPSK
jgi:hypothetical protein